MTCDRRAIGRRRGVVLARRPGHALEPSESSARVLGFDDAGDVTVILQAGDAVGLVAMPPRSPRSTSTPPAASPPTSSQRHLRPARRLPYWQLVLDSAAAGRAGLRGARSRLAAEPPVIEPGKAILEIYAHDEDASRWGTATWATGAATGTEGIWSAAGWQDVTPEGVNAHIIWGSRSPESGILAKQNAASWNVETYDPDRILDPGNFDSPFYPQLVAGLPIRISHDALVIRTGYIDRIAYKHKDPDYRGQLLCTDTIALLNQAMVPEDSILGNTMIERVQDAISAAGVAVGGIPLPPTTPTGHSVSPLDTDNPRERSVWDHVTAVTEEKLFMCFVRADAGLAFRQWGFPIDRGREITAANLEDLEAISHDEGLYSVVRVQGSDPDLPPIEREVAPLPRYGRRVYERDGAHDRGRGLGRAGTPGAVVAGSAVRARHHPLLHRAPTSTTSAAWRSWSGSRSPCPAPSASRGASSAVSCSWSIKAHDERGATWQFLFAVATDGS